MRKALKKSSVAYRIAREPVGFIANIVQITATVAPLFLLFFGYQDLSETSTGSTPLGFPLRLLLMSVCAAGLGCALGFGITYLTKHNSSVTRGLAFLSAFVWAGLVIIVADALSLTSSKLPDFSLFVTIGMAFTLGILTFFFRAGATSVTIAIVEDRAAMMVCFAATSAVVGLIVHIGRVLT